MGSRGRRAATTSTPRATWPRSPTRSRLDRARGHRREQLGGAGRVSAGQSDWDALDYRNHLPGHRQHFTENNPNHILPDMTFAGANALPNTGPSTSARARASLAGDERHAQHLGEPDAPARQAQHEGRVLLRAHRAARPAVEQRRHLQLQLRRGQSARHQPRLGERDARAPQHLHRRTTTTSARCRRSTSPSSSSRTTGASRSVHARPRRPLLAHRRRLRPDRDIGWFDPAPGIRRGR